MRKDLLSMVVSLLLVSTVPAKAAAPLISSRFTLSPTTRDTLPENANAHSGFIWQGFEHEWKRRVFGLFRTPHRISKLGSEILDEQHELSLDQNLSSSASLRLQQSTGVDGDWMKPVIHYDLIHSIGVEVQRGTLEVDYIDDTEDSATHGNALSQIRGFFEFQIPSTLAENATTQALIHGFALQTKCTEGPTGPSDCNSNGIWPYRIKIQLNSCSRKYTSLDSGLTSIRCGYAIETGRAWTPRKGGLPPFETKPLNRKTRYSFRIGVQILSGEPRWFHTQSIELGTTNARARPNVPGKANEFSMNGMGDNTYPSATLGIQSLEYDFKSKPSLLFTTEEQDMGRYLSGIGTSVQPESYHPESGVMDFKLSDVTHVPLTVKNAELTVSTGVTLLQFASSNAVAGAQSEKGLLCVNSSPQAPAFSRWEKCGSILQGDQRSQDTVVRPVELTQSFR